MFCAVDHQVEGAEAPGLRLQVPARRPGQYQAPVHVIGERDRTGPGEDFPPGGAVPASVGEAAVDVQFRENLAERLRLGLVQPAGQPSCPVPAGVCSRTAYRNNNADPTNSATKNPFRAKISTGGLHGEPNPANSAIMATNA